MPADEDWIPDPTRNALHNCPAHYRSAFLLSWRLTVSELELSHDDTANVKNIAVIFLPITL